VDVLFDGEVPVHYGFVYLEPGDGSDVELLTARGGQANGLCGARYPGHLLMVTGLHTGPAPLRVELHHERPPLDEQWEDVVEVPVTLTSEECWLTAFDWAQQVPTPAPGDYRARWSATGMDQAPDTRIGDEPALDRYLLQLWPAPVAPDAVVRLGSENAAYWHREAANTQPPPTPQELAAEHAEQERQQLAAQAQWEAAQEIQDWGGRAPTDQLRALGGRTSQLAYLNRDVVDALAALAGAQQRAVSVWAARQACTVAGIAELDWIEQALESVSRGEPLPEQWDDADLIWDRVFPPPAGETEVETVFTGRYWEVGEEYIHEPMAPEATAIDAIRQAAAQDPAQAVMGAIDALARGHLDPAVVLLDVQQRLTEGTLPPR